MKIQKAAAVIAIIAVAVAVFFAINNSKSKANQEQGDKHMNTATQSSALSHQEWMLPSQ